MYALIRPSRFLIHPGFGTIFIVRLPTEEQGLEGSCHDLREPMGLNKEICRDDRLQRERSQAQD